jgi:hypothetical protein
MEDIDGTNEIYHHAVTYNSGPLQKGSYRMAGAVQDHEYHVSRTQIDPGLQRPDSRDRLLLVEDRGCSIKPSVHFLPRYPHYRRASLVRFT